MGGGLPGTSGGGGLPPRGTGYPGTGFPVGGGSDLSGAGGGGGGYSYGDINFDFGPVPLFSPAMFNAPTWEEAQKSPGYAFRLGEGVTALDRSAAAKGGLRTGGHNKDIMQYGQNIASQEYSNVFDRALKEYGARYQAQKDMYAPLLAQWQRKASAEQAKRLAMFNAQFYRSGGGGNSQPDLSGWWGPEPTY
jgi:hypothetical protein